MCVIIMIIIIIIIIMIMIMIIITIISIIIIIAMIMIIIIIITNINIIIFIIIIMMIIIWWTLFMDTFRNLSGRLFSSIFSEHFPKLNTFVTRPSSELLRLMIHEQYLRVWS